MKPLSYVAKRWLSYIESNPGLSRSELGQALFAEMNPYYSLRRAIKIVGRLHKRGLVEFDLIHEGGRAGVQGVYMVGKGRPSKAGYLGIFGRVKTARELDCEDETDSQFLEGDPAEP